MAGEETMEFPIGQYMYYIVLEKEQNMEDLWEEAGSGRNTIPLPWESNRHFIIVQLSEIPSDQNQILRRIQYDKSFSKRW